MKAPTVLFVACIAMCAVLTIGCGEDPPPPEEKPTETVKPEPKPEPPPKPKPKPIALAELAPVTIQPGAGTTVELKVERNDNEGPVTVQVEGAPEGVTVKAAEIPKDKSAGQLELTAAQTLGDAETTANLTVTVKVGDQEAKQTIALKIPKLNLPTFMPVPEAILQPGTNRSLSMNIERNGYQGPLELRVEGAPAKVTCKATNVAAVANATKLDVAAAGDAPNGSHKVRVATTLYGRNISVEVPLKIESRPFQVKAFQVVTLTPGETKRIEVPIERGSYKGALQIKGDALPPGVTVREVSVAPDQSKAILEIDASADAEQRVSSSKIVSTAGHLTTTGPIVLRIESGDDTYLPPAIAANPEISHLLRRGSIGGRLTTESKQALLDFYGGTPESEAAVMRGLKWLAAHQQPDGSWPLDEYDRDIQGCDCKTDFEKEIDEKSETAGTCFGILPFLGAGVTHNRAPKNPPELAGYQDVVEKGLIYLARNQDMKEGKTKGYLGGNTYAHALGTIAFCEAYGLSGDETARINAQLALKYLLDGQHEKGGGWRYSPGTSGDMSVTGWVFLAIRSAQLAGIEVRRLPLTKAGRFVDSCAVGPAEAKDSRYSYTPGPGQPEKLSMTAAGLLTRQYLGWRNDEPDLLAGCEYLMQHLPPESGSNLGSIYTNYYATQVLHHMEGPNFDLWNYRMREHLIRTQEKTGHKAGSWNAQGTDYGARAGRMYATAMALMTLQVYYRHLPMYRHVKRTGT